MKKLFTHLENHDGLHRDTTGRVESLEDALRQASQTAGSVLAEDLANGRTPVRIRLTIADDAGDTKATVTVDAHIECGAEAG